MFRYGRLDRWVWFASNIEAGHLRQLMTRPDSWRVFLWPKEPPAPVIEIARDWIGFAIGVLSLLLSFWVRPAGTRQRVRVRRRRLKLGAIEWTAYDREDDRQS